MPVPEAEVLKPVDRLSTDSDDWEIFALNNARVSYESNGKSASLLAAYADMPLKVEGRLEAPARSQSHYLVQKPYKPIEIVIRNITRFSYGELNDGTVALWAEGGAGWFQISPAPQYQAIYEGMTNAVQILYFVTDIYQEPRKKGGGPSAQLVFQEYAEDSRFSCNDIGTAETLFNQHHRFLIMCFLGQANGIGWSNTPLYQYFRRRHPKDFERCKARVEGRCQPILATEPTPGPTPVVETTVPTAQTRPRPRKSTTPHVYDAPKKDGNWWEAAALFEFMQKAVNQHALRVGRNHITLERVAELIVRRYEIDDVQTAQHVLLVHAQNLSYMMAHPRRKNIRYFVSEPIYHTLVAGTILSAADQRRAAEVELRPRRDHGTLKDVASDSSDTSDEDSNAMKTPVRQPPDRTKRGRLSVLRPRNSHVSGKSMRSGKHKAGKGKAPLLDEDEQSEESTESEASSSDDDMAIDTPTQGLSPGRERQKLDTTNADVDVNVDADTDEIKDEAKGENSQQTRTNSVSNPPDAPPSTDSSDDTDSTTPAALVQPSIPSARKPRSHSHARSHTITHIVSTPLPTYEPNGPRDSWICGFDGCSQRIYGCSKELGRRLITEHLEDHAKGTEKVVGILWREQDKLQLPVSNLIKKIREMSDASTMLFPVPGKQALRPIHRPG